MDKITVQFILLTICLPSVDTAISKVYEANPDLYNTKSTNEPLSFKQTDSLLLCSKLYVNGYNCFNFNIQTGTCLLYNSCNSSNMTVSESGWRFFHRCLFRTGRWVYVGSLFFLSFFNIKLRTKNALSFTNALVRGFTHINHRYTVHVHSCFFFHLSCFHNLS